MTTEREEQGQNFKFLWSWVGCGERNFKVLSFFAPIDSAGGLIINSKMGQKIEFNSAIRRSWRSQFGKIH